MRVPSLAILALFGAGAAAGAQARGDSLSLGALVTQALARDPRQQQLALQARASELRLANIAAEHRPTLALDGQAQYQSAVTKIAVPIPNITIPSPTNDTYDAHVGAQLPLFDPTTSPRRAAERAQLAESQAQTRSTLFGLRQEINDAFFAAAISAQRLDEVNAAITDISARLRETVIRFHEGAALPGDTAAVAAALLQRRQDVLQLEAARSAALARLSDLVGRTVSRAEPFRLPDDSAAVAIALRGLDSLRARPEYEQFAATRARLALQSDVEAAQEKPRLSAFGRVGYGRPGLNLLSRDFQAYWLGGVQLHWTPWNWGTTERDREVTAVQREIVATNEAAFTRSLQRGVQDLVATITRLDSTLALDEEIVALRERIDRETRAKLVEGVVTTAEYVDRSTDLLSARLVRVQHRVELAQARATFLTTVGLEVP